MPWPETVLLVHNRYRHAGGEDAVYEAEGALLEARGHRVLRYERHNHELARSGPLRNAVSAVWNGTVHAEVRALVARERPDVVHVHNTLAVLSPAVHHAARAAGAAVVQTLHNFRLLCPGAQLLRDGAPCEACVGRPLPWRGVAHGCYRGDRGASAVVAGLLVTHRVLGTWREQVDAFIVLSQFARARFEAGGLAPERLHVKGGFLWPDPGPGTHRDDAFLYVGRLSPEKGVGVLLEAWRLLETPTRLAIVGEGPMGDAVRAAAAADPRIQWLGARPRDEVLARMREARALVLPSLCYENFPTVLVEAFATGLPVVAAEIGSVAELVQEGVNGVRFRAGDPAALAERVRALHVAGENGAAALAELGHNARAAYLAAHTAEHAYARLLDIYAAAREARAAVPRIKVRGSTP